MSAAKQLVMPRPGEMDDAANLVALMMLHVN